MDLYTQAKLAYKRLWETEEPITREWIKEFTGDPFFVSTVTRYNLKIPEEVRGIYKSKEGEECEVTLSPLEHQEGISILFSESELKKLIGDRAISKHWGGEWGVRIDILPNEEILIALIPPQEIHRALEVGISFIEGTNPTQTLKVLLQEIISGLR